MTNEKNHVEINFGHIGNEKKAMKIKHLLQGKTYYNLQVQYSPMMGNWPVTVFTEYHGCTTEELTMMVLGLLADEL